MSEKTEPAKEEFTEEMILAQLERRQIVTVRVYYSGSGDSGGVDEIAYLGEQAPYTLPIPDDLNTAIRNSAEEFLEKHHPSYEDNEGGQGEIVIDVADHTMTMDHGDNYTTTDESTNERPFGPSLNEVAAPTCTCRDLSDGHLETCPYWKAR